MFVVLTLFRRLPGLPLVSQHLLLHVPHRPGGPRLVVQGALLQVGRAQPQPYPGHEGALGGLEEEQGEQPAEEPHFYWRAELRAECDLAWLSLD